MSFKFVKEVISPEELVQAYPLPARDVLRKKERDKLIKDVITGASDKFLNHRTMFCRQ
jgi:3-deoxy-7-phosphoheptulonate synthase